MRTPDWSTPDGAIRLYLGDCLTLLPQLEPGSVDAVVTDPPYGIDGSSGTKNTARGKTRFLENDTEALLVAETIPRFRASLAICGRAVVTPGGRHAWKYPEPAAIGFIYQPASVGLCQWGAANCQPVLFYGRDPRLGISIGRLVYTCTESADINGHPCPKPMGVASWMVERASIDGDTVLDPFMGSAAFGAACIRTQRRYIGCEISETYFSIAVKRIQAELARFPLFEPQPARQLELLERDART